jgi:hypothetical protein
MVERFPDIVGRLKAMLERFMTTLDCVDAAFISDQTLDQLPQPCAGRQNSRRRSRYQPARTRTALAAVLALAASPTGFTVAELATKARAMAGLTPAGYTGRQAAYDLKKLRGKSLITKLGRTRRYEVQPSAIRAIAALFILRNYALPHSRRRALTPPRSQTCQLDSCRSTLRTTPYPDAAPVSRTGNRSLDNSLSLRLFQAANQRILEACRGLTDQQLDTSVPSTGRTIRELLIHAVSGQLNSGSSHKRTPARRRSISIGSLAWLRRTYGRRTRIK